MKLEALVCPLKCYVTVHWHSVHHSQRKYSKYHWLFLSILPTLPCEVQPITLPLFSGAGLCQQHVHGEGGKGQKAKYLVKISNVYVFESADGTPVLYWNQGL